MTQEHPIRPPHELVQQWVSFACENEGYETWQDLATQAARWGADQELEACCADLRMVLGPNQADWLRSVRRPKPPSLKEQGLKALDSFEGFTGSLEEVDIIRRALESLPD